MAHRSEHHVILEALPVWGPVTEWRVRRARSMQSPRHVVILVVILFLFHALVFLANWSLLVVWCRTGRSGSMILIIGGAAGLGAGWMIGRPALGIALAALDPGIFVFPVTGIHVLIRRIRRLRRADVAPARVVHR